MRWLAVLLLAALLIPGSVSAQGDPPPPPHAFYGGAAIRGQLAPIGTVAEVRGVGVKLTSTNPITTTVAGKYGGPTLGEGKLAAQGWITTGAPIEFYLDGERAQVSIDKITWGSSVAFQPGVVSRVHLRVLHKTFLPGWQIPKEIP
jgi:hypothetical protein